MKRQHPYNPKCKCGRCKAVKALISYLPPGREFIINPSYDKIIVKK